MGMPMVWAFSPWSATPLRWARSSSRQTINNWLKPCQTKCRKAGPKPDLIGIGIGNEIGNLNGNGPQSIVVAAAAVVIIIVVAFVVVVVAVVVAVVVYLPTRS